jgi:ATP sulfurylase
MFAHVLLAKSGDLAMGHHGIFRQVWCGSHDAFGKNHAD